MARLISVCNNELWDETFGGRISRDELFELIDDVSAIGLVFNATYLFQPELIVLVNLSDYEQASKYIDCSERKWLTEQEIESIIKLSEDALHSRQTPKVKFKDIFTPAWRLFQEYVASGNHCRSLLLRVNSALTLTQIVKRGRALLGYNGFNRLLVPISGTVLIQ